MLLPLESVPGKQHCNQPLSHSAQLTFPHTFPPECTSPPPQRKTQGPSPPPCPCDSTAISRSATPETIFVSGCDASSSVPCAPKPMHTQQQQAVWLSTSSSSSGGTVTSAAAAAMCPGMHRTDAPTPYLPVAPFSSNLHCRPLHPPYYTYSSRPPHPTHLFVLVDQEVFIQLLLPLPSYRCCCRCLSTTPTPRPQHSHTPHTHPTHLFVLVDEEVFIQVLTQQGLCSKAGKGGCVLCNRVGTRAGSTFVCFGG
jgi:hypothetical protein